MGLGPKRTPLTFAADPDPGAAIRFDFKIRLALIKTDSWALVEECARCLTGLFVGLSAGL